MAGGVHQNFQKNDFRNFSDMQSLSSLQVTSLKELKLNTERLCAENSAGLLTPRSKLMGAFTSSSIS
jgi:hypothetical protein